MDILNIKTGKKEIKKNILGEKQVKIVSVVIKEKNKDGDKLNSPLVQFFVKHPDREELLILTKIKYLDGEILKIKGLWVQLDSDGEFYKGSSIDLILKKLNVKTLSDTYGLSIDTVMESKDSNYLCMKIY